MRLAHGLTKGIGPYGRREQRRGTPSLITRQVAEETDVIRVTLRMAFHRERSGDVLQILNPMAERTRIEPGCLACNIYQDVRDAGVIMLEELWRCEAEMGRHLRSEQYRNILLVMEMALEPPEVRFDEIARSTGVETIEKARLGAAEV